MDTVLVSVTEACAALGISRTQFYREVATARLSTVKIGKRTLVKTAEVYRYADGL